MSEKNTNVPALFGQMVFDEQQMQQLEAVKDQEKIRKKLAELDRKRERAG